MKMKYDNGSVAINVTINENNKERELKVKLYRDELEAHKKALGQFAKETSNAKMVAYHTTVDVISNRNVTLERLHAIVWAEENAAISPVELPSGEEATWAVYEGKDPAKASGTVSVSELNGFEIEINFPRGGYSAENYLHMVELTGLPTGLFCKQFGIPEQTFYKHRNGTRTMKFLDWVDLVQDVTEFLEGKTKSNAG